MSLKRRLEKLEAKAHGRYVISSWEDYYRVRRELGCEETSEVLRPFREVTNVDPYEELKARGELIETPEFERLKSRNIFEQIESGEIKLRTREE